MGANSISATIGPAICGECYEVSEEIFTELVQLHPTAAAKRIDGTFALESSKSVNDIT